MMAVPDPSDDHDGGEGNRGGREGNDAVAALAITFCACSAKKEGIKKGKKERERPCSAEHAAKYLPSATAISSPNR